MEFLLVLNPISGNEDKRMILDKLKNQLSEKDYLFKLETEGTHDRERIAETLRKNSVDRILVAGGDGTLKTVAEAMVAHPKTIGILPCGSANGLARDLNLPEQPEQYIKKALQENTKTIDVLQCGDELGLHISDIGINAELIRSYEDGVLRGKLGYALKSIPTLFQSQLPTEFTIEVNGETLRRTAVMIGFANSRKFGTGAVVNPQGKIDDGFFEVLIFKNLKLSEIIKTWQEAAELSSDFIEIIKTKKATVSTQKPLSFQIDGEFCHKRKSVSFQMRPNYLSVAGI